MKNTVDSYYKAISEIEDYAIVSLDAKGVIKDWNKGAEKLKGYKASEIIGEKIRIFYTKEDLKKKVPEKLIEKAALNGKASAEGWRLRKDGSRFWASILITALHDDKNKLAGFLKITHDLTERKTAEEKLRLINDELERRVEERTAKLASSEKQYRDTLDNMIEGVQIHDFNWRYVYVNDALLKYSQYTKQELLGHTVMEKYPGIEQTGLFKVLQRCMKKRVAEQMETEFTFPNGSKGHFQLSIQPSPEGIFILSVDITERKKAELNLEQSIKELTDYKIALDESDIVAITDQKGIIKHVNENFCKISKYCKEELIGQDHRIINSGHHTKEFIRNLWVTIANGKIWKGELKNKAKDGTYYWVDTTIVPFLNQSGKPYQYLAIRADITERKKAEEELVQSIKELTDYKFAIDESDIVAITDQKGIIKHVNDNFCKISKYTREELIGQDHRIINSGYHPKQFIRNLWVTIAKGKIWKGELKNKAKDGTYYWVDTTIVPFLNESGKPYQYLAIRSDITERKKAEEDLEQNIKELADYKFAIDESAIVAITDQKGIIKHVNDNFCKISKYSEAELLGQDHRIINSGFHSKEFIKEIWITIANGKIWKGELKNKAKDGSIYWVDTTIVPFLDKAGKPYQYLAIRSDITERKNAEEEVLKMNRLYAFLSGVNQSIVHIKNEEELLNKVCAVATGAGCFKMAWVGMLGDNGRLNMVSVSGDKVIAEKMMKYSGMDYTIPMLKDTPTGRALSSGNYAFSNNTLHDPAMQPWKDEFAQHGIKANISLPIRKGKHVIGIFGLNSGIENFFDKAEIALLDEATRDIAFALELFEKEKLHKQAEELILQNERRLKKAQQIAHIGHWELNFATGIAEWSEESCRIYGLDPADNIQSYEEWVTFVHPDDLEYVMEFLKEQRQTLGKSSFDHRIVRRDGTIRHVHSESKFEFDASGKSIGLYGISHDITERKLAEENLKKNEAKLKDAQAIAHVGSWEIDMIDNGLYWSDEMFRLLGYHPGARTPTNELFLSMVHPDDAERIGKDFVETFETLKDASATFKLIAKDGTLKHAFCEWKFEFDRHGVPIRVFGIVQDITEKKESEEKLRQNESKLKEAQTVALMGSWEVDILSNTEEWSDELFYLFGYERGDIPGGLKSFLAVIHPGDFDFVNAQVIDAHTNHVSTSFDFRFIRKDGTVRYGYSKSKFEFDSNQKPIRLFGVIQDITEKKEAEERLRLSESKLKEAQSVGHMGNWGIDLASNTHQWSDEMFRLFGFEKEEVTPSAELFLSIMHPNDAAYAAEKIAEAFVTFGDSSFEFMFIRKDGIVRHGYSEWKFEFDAQKRPTRLYGIVQDITEGKEAENEIKELNEHLEARVKARTSELEEANKQLESFSYTVSHDLRNPLQVINGYASIMSLKYKTVLNEDAQALLGKIQYNTRHMSQIMDDLLDFSKLGSAIVAKKMFDMNELLTVVLAELKAGNANFNTQIKLADLKPAYGDKRLMHQVIINLLSNAVKYSRKAANPVVEIGMEQLNGEDIYCIKDNGAGFDMQQADRLFAVFQRLHKSSEFEGTGVGLALVHSIITKHGGKIWAESVIDQGATFRFTLPKMEVETIVA